MPMYTQVRTASDLFSVHVVDEDGLPHVELTAYACRSPRHHSPRTARAYTGEVVAFASRAGSNPEVLRQGWRLLGPPHEARVHVSWFDEAGEPVDAPDIRTPLPLDVPPGREITLAAFIPTPAAAGRMRLQLSLVQEGLRYLHGDAKRIPVRIAEDAPSKPAPPASRR